MANGSIRNVHPHEVRMDVNGSAIHHESRVLAKQGDTASSRDPPPAPWHPRGGRAKQRSQETVDRPAICTCPTADSGGPRHRRRRDRHQHRVPPRRGRRPRRRATDSTTGRPACMRASLGCGAARPAPEVQRRPYSPQACTAGTATSPSPTHLHPAPDPHRTGRSHPPSQRAPPRPPRRAAEPPQHPCRFQNAAHAAGQR